MFIQVLIYRNDWKTWNLTDEKIFQISGRSVIIKKYWNKVLSGENKVYKMSPNINFTAGF